MPGVETACGLARSRSRAGSRPLILLHHQTIALLSTSRYQLDQRFVRLTLLLDQGADAQGPRHIQDPNFGKYDSLTILLAAVEERALVLLGGPGSGKTTLLRRLQLEHTWAQLDEPDGRVSFFCAAQQLSRGAGRRYAAGSTGMAGAGVAAAAS
ncbi:MAG: hypothetical protein M5U34_41320 [Chloroflexi bacterium]|nr:hypothetical protein [Chloroflexota bacterium]